MYRSVVVGLTLIAERTTCPARSGAIDIVFWIASSATCVSAWRVGPSIVAARVPATSPPCFLSLRSTIRSTSARSADVIIPRSTITSASVSASPAAQAVHAWVNWPSSTRSAFTVSAPKSRLRSVSKVASA